MNDDFPPHLIAGAKLNLARLRDHREALHDAINEQHSSRAYIPMDLAVTLRLWCQDSRTSHSLVRQLNLKSMSVPDGTNHAKSGIATGLAPPTVYGRAHPKRPFIPDRLWFSSPLAPDAPWVGFSDWWMGTALAVEQMLKLTRQEIVASWANKFGGAHVDPDEPDLGSWSIAGGLGLHVWVSPHPPRPGVGRTFSTAVAVERPGPQWMRLKEDSAAWSMSAAVLERIATELLSGLEAVGIDEVLGQD